MGQMFEASCIECAHRQDVVIGGGRETFSEHSVWPIFCRDCDTMAAANVQVRPLRCLKCRSEHVLKYGISPISPTNTKINIQWGDDTICDGLHYCPHCKNMSLEFGSSPRIFFS